MHVPKEVWEKLANATDKKPAFVEYVESIIKLQEENREDLKEAGYNVCGTIQFDELDEVPQFNRIIRLSCDLELPKEVRSDTRTEEEIWEEIKMLASEYKEKNK